MREIDRLTTERYAMPSLLLMEAAANQAARAIGSHFANNPMRLKVLVLCGRGNNGGDGAALARVLWMTGAQVDLLLFGQIKDTHGDARTNFETLKQLALAEPEHQARLSFQECLTVEDFQRVLRVNVSYQVIADALFGTGLTRPLEGIYKQVLEHLSNIRPAHTGRRAPYPLIVSLDIPSGLNADLDELIGDAVRADLTVTFTAPKPANVLPPASDFNGQLVVTDIGSPLKLIEESPSQLYLIDEEDARTWLERTRYTPGSYKNTHGHALVIAGSRQFTGAAVLASEAAMCSGAGLVTVATASSAMQAVAARLMPEVMTVELAENDQGAISAVAIEHALQLAERAHVVALGPGLSSADESTRRFVRELVERRTTPLVLDADGLNALAPWPSELHGSDELPLILTPHIGEMRRLIGASDQATFSDRVKVAREFAVAHQLILVLKGTRTLVAAPDGRVCINPTGNAGLGTAGAGDTLTGIITGFLAQAYGTLKEKADAFQATLAALYVGGMAGDLAARELGMRAMVASDIREHLGAAICALDPAGELP